MTTSRTTASTSSRPADPPSPGASLDDDEDLIMREALARVERVKARKVEEATRKKAEEEAAKKAAEEVRIRAAARELEDRRRRMAEAATARSRRGSLPEETSGSPRRPVVEIRRIRSKGKEKAQEEAAGGNPDDGGDENDDDEDDRTPWRPSIVKKEVSAHPTSERLAVLESQVAQLLADNRQLRDGQVKANTYHRHFNRKLDWLITDAARRRRSPPELPEAGPSELSKKRRRVVDSDEEEEMEKEEVEVEEEGGEERDKPAPKKARSEKGKERAE
ncbi:MAG: hypothetical protein NXY57DRAFT_970416 [Lentinula lateritia]|nr:MAG: hypothetical protein NXY57DRAFT_970416 [Lentinula lateritia]